MTKSANDCFTFNLDIDQLITISGMVIRTSNLIPEMRAGKTILFAVRFLSVPLIYFQRVNYCQAGAN